MVALLGVAAQKTEDPLLQGNLVLGGFVVEEGLDLGQLPEQSILALQGYGKCLGGFQTIDGHRGFPLMVEGIGIGHPAVLHAELKDMLAAIGIRSGNPHQALDHKIVMPGPIPFGQDNLVFFKVPGLKMPQYLGKFLIR